MGQVQLPEIDGWRGLKESLEQLFGFPDRGRAIQEMSNAPNLRRRMGDVDQVKKKKILGGVVRAVLGYVCRRHRTRLALFDITRVFTIHPSGVAGVFFDGCVEGVEDLVGRLGYVAGRGWFSHHRSHQCRRRQRCPG